MPRLRRRPGALYDIAVRSRCIELIEESPGVSAAVVVDAAGGLVTEPFVNPHLHLDKVYTLQRLDEESSLRAYHGEGMGNAMHAIEAASRVKESYSQDWIVENAREALRAAAVHGNTYIRAFADVDSKARLEGVKALLQVKEEFRGVVELQVVAFPQDGVLREPGAAELVREAVALGADVVGGIPWIEYTDAAAREHVRQMFEIAVAGDRPVSMLVDDASDPGLRTLEMMAVSAIEAGWQGRVLAHHARAMALYPEPYFQKLTALLRQADMPVVTDPHTGPLHARVRELLAAGVRVCLGQDDISDAYYPFGRNNMLEVAFLACASAVDDHRGRHGPPLRHDHGGRCGGHGPEGLPPGTWVRRLTWWCWTRRPYSKPCVTTVRRCTSSVTGGWWTSTQPSVREMARCFVDHQSGAPLGTGSPPYHSLPCVS